MSEQATHLQRSERFRLSQGAFLSRLFYLFGTYPVVIVLALTGTAVILSMTVDIMFLIIALMIVFILAPAIFAWLYISKGMNPEATFNIAWHVLRINEEGIAVDIIKPVYKTREEEEDPEAIPPNAKAQLFSEKANHGEQTENESETIESWIDSKSIFIPLGRMKDVLTGGDGLTIRLKDGPGFIAVPHSAFYSPEEYEAFKKLLMKLMPQYHESI